jgi:hypothetical protein
MERAMGPGTIQKTVSLLKVAFEGLHVDIPLIQLERLAIMVHEAMTVQARSFHTPEHIFNLADASDSIQALAALFHDVVYYEIDQGFTPEIEAVLRAYIREEPSDNGGRHIRLVDRAVADDRAAADDRATADGGAAADSWALELTLGVFGFDYGQRLIPARGQNEFLSALLMNEKLGGILRRRDLLKVTACIEATIPFRGLSEDGLPPMEALARRLAQVNEALRLGLQEAEIVAAVKRAVAFSNRDVDNFAEQDTGSFLDNTWKLLPETNPSLRLRGIYTIGSYRRALEKMEAFLNHLDPETVFNTYDDEPPPGEYARRVAMAYRNVNTARQYLGLKLLAIGLLEALALLSGGDAPVALFMGGTEESEGTRKMEAYLPSIASVSSVDESSTLFGLLAFGRASSSSFDLKNSPLSLFIFRLLGWDHTQALLTDAKRMFAGELDAPSFLDRVPTGLAVAVANACAELATTRRDALLAYAESRMRRRLTAGYH